MSDYKAKDAAFTSTANSIRSKTGSSSLIQWDENTGFKTAIDSIVVGAGSAISIVDTADSHGGTVRTITGVSLAGDTVTAAHLESGYTAHDAQGNAITGSLVPSSGADIPTFTGEIVGGDSPSFSSLTCDKTFAEAVECYETIDYAIFEMVNNGASLYYGMNIRPDTWPNPTVLYYYASWVVAQLIITYSSNGNITYEFDPISANDSTDLSASGATVTAPAGYYESNATYTIASGTEGTPTATKGTVSSNSVTVTPSVTNTAGYISGGTHTGTAVTVSASELVSGNKEITANGTNIDVTNYATASVSVTPSLQAKTNISPTTSSQTISADNGYDGLSSVQINAMPTMTLPTSAAASATSGYTSKATISRSTSDQYINIPTGYNAAGAYYKVNAVSNGTVTAPSTISGTSAIVSTGTNTLTLTKTVSVTPSVTTAGYISSGTAGDSSVSLTASVTTQAAQTIHPSTSDQSIAASRYLTGAQTIKAVTMSNLTADNIKSGVTVKIGDSTDDDCVTSVTGTYSGGTSKNTQVLQSTSRTTATSLTKVIGDLTVSKTGTYDVYWSGTRTNTSSNYTWGTRLYVDSTGYGTENTTWSNNVQSNHLTNVSLTANQKLSVYARGRGGSYYACVPMLVIVEN